jgi:hypothetical protein
MASSYSTSLGIEKMATGDQSGAWGTTSNHNWDIIDRITAYTSVAITTNADTATLTVREASPGSGTENLQDGMYRVIKFTGALDSNCTVTIAPNTAKVFFIIINATTDSGSSGPYSIILTQGSGANVTVQNGNNAVIYCDGAGSGAVVTDALSDLQIGNDLSLVSDSAVLNMGADNDITITHVADVGLKLKQAGATGDGSPFVLTLQTGELDIAADDILGQIDFQAPDEATGTDAQLVAAGISAISEGDFSSSSNATKLSFKTGASAAATEKMYITSAGNVNMKNTDTGDDTPMVLTLQTGETDIASADVLGQIDFQAPNEAAGTDAILVAAGIAAVSEGDFSSSNNATKLSFKTAASAAAAETMSLSSVGNLTISGDLTVSGDDLFMATNTSGAILVADGTNYNPAVVSGDATIATNGALTIANDAVSLAKMASGTDGNIISYDASGNPVAIATGNDGQVLTSAGAGAQPAFEDAGGGAWNYISTTTASNDATVVITSGIDSTYPEYMIDVIGYLNATDQAYIYMRTSTDGGSSYDSGGSNYQWATQGYGADPGACDSQSSTDTAITLTSSNSAARPGNGAAEGSNLRIFLKNPSGTTFYHMITWEIGICGPTVGRPVVITGTGFRASTGNVDAVQFYASSGNVSVGTFRLYGLSGS